MKFKTGNQWRKINKTKTQFFEKINKIHKTLLRLTKKKRLQVTNIRNEREVGYQHRSHGHEQDNKNTLNNSMPTNLITQVKWTNS